MPQHRKSDPHPASHRPAREPLLRELQGAVLRATRQRRALRLTDVAGRAGVSMAYLSEVERGRKEASSEILAGVCAALDLTIADLLLACARDLAAAGVRTELATHRRGPDPAVHRGDEFRGDRRRGARLRGDRLRGAQADTPTAEQRLGPRLIELRARRVSTGDPGGPGEVVLLAA